MRKVTYNEQKYNKCAYRPNIDPPYDNPNKRGCGNCEYNHREKQDTFSCTNEDSEYYASFTSYDDVCEEWEDKEI